MVHSQGWVSSPQAGRRHSSSVRNPRALDHSDIDGVGPAASLGRLHRHCRHDCVGRPTDDSGLAAKSSGRPRRDPSRPAGMGSKTGVAVTLAAIRCPPQTFATDAIHSPERHHATAERTAMARAGRADDLSPAVIPRASPSAHRTRTIRSGHGPPDNDAPPSGPHSASVHKPSTNRDSSGGAVPCPHCRPTGGTTEADGATKR